MNRIAGLTIAGFLVALLAVAQALRQVRCGKVLDTSVSKFAPRPAVR